MITSSNSLIDSDELEKWVGLALKLFFFFYNIINHKQILTKYYNHQEHKYFYLGGYKNTMLEQKLPKIKVLKEKGKVKK